MENTQEVVSLEAKEAERKLKEEVEKAIKTPVSTVFVMEDKLKAEKKTVDASKGMPLTIGQFRRLKKEFGLKMQDVIAMNLETDELWGVIFVVFTTADPSLTEADVSLVKSTDFNRFALALLQSMRAEVDRPT